jgi:uncharacterized protein YigA (DUF484 family)
LGLAGATVRLFPDRWRLGAPSGFTHLALSRQALSHCVFSVWVNSSTISVH